MSTSTLSACSADTPTATPEEIIQNIPSSGWIGDEAQVLGHAWRDGRITQKDGLLHRTQIAIVGAGVSGLAAARALRQRGIDDFQIFDLDIQAGGNAQGHELKGLLCPQGAHYLPLPGPHAKEVTALLFELGLLRTEWGRTVAEERYLCHSPQERAFVNHHWQQGLLPVSDFSEKTKNQYIRFEQAIQSAMSLGFSSPTMRTPWTSRHAALDNQVFRFWLTQEGFDDPWLLCFLDYVCRDDYGAGIDAVSAWAGLHYFASRHGFNAPQNEESPASDNTAVFTWPQGNAWLTQKLVQPLGDRLRLQNIITQISLNKHDVTVHVWNAANQTPERWVAKTAIICTPLFISHKLLTPECRPEALKSAAQHLQYAPWLVTNLYLKAPLLERIGTTMAWDNVALSPGPLTSVEGLPSSLGYVNATHQSLQSVPSATVLTHYWALGDARIDINRQRRQALLQNPWQAWGQRVLADLLPLHPDLSTQLQAMALRRWGHAMAIPTPGTRGHPALQALAKMSGRLRFAHSDLSGYSVFEEAFTHGHRAGIQAAK